MTQQKRKIPVSEFKSKMLSILAEIEESGAELIITRRNKAVATVIPFPPERVAAESGTLAHLLIDEKDLVSPVAERDWTVLRG